MFFFFFFLSGTLMQGEDLNKASVTSCAALQEIADVLMKRHDCQTVAGCSISNVRLSGFSVSFALLKRDIFSGTLFLNRFVYPHI